DMGEPRSDVLSADHGEELDVSAVGTRANEAPGPRPAKPGAGKGLVVAADDNLIHLCDADTRGIRLADRCHLPFGGKASADQVLDVDQVQGPGRERPADRAPHVCRGPDVCRGRTSHLLPLVVAGYCSKAVTTRKPNLFHIPMAWLHG